MDTAYGNEIKTFQKDVVKFARNDLKYAVDGGLVTRSEAAKMLEKNPNYVPTYREAEIKDYAETFEQFDDISSLGAFRKREGSSSDFSPLYSSLVARNSMIIKKTELNNVLRIVGEATTTKNIAPEKLAKELSEEDTVNSIKNVAYINSDADGISRATYFDAEKNTYVTIPVPHDIVRGLREWSGEEQLAFLKWKLVGDKTVGDITRAMAKGNKLFKDLITGWNPLFGLRNIVGDTQTALSYTQYGMYNYARNYGRAIHQMMTNGDLFKAYKEGGGLYSTLVKDSSEGYMKLSKTVLTSPIRALEEFNNALETIPRFTEFCASAEDSYIKKYGKKGLKNLTPSEKANLIASKLDRKSRILAVSDAKEVTVNFARSGRVGRLLNSSLVPYFNPALQGIYKMGKTGYNAFQNNIGSGMLYMTKLLSIGAGASVAWELAMSNNDEYQQLSSYTKNQYYCIPIGDGHFLKLRKSRDLSSIATPFEHWYRTAIVQTPDGTTVEAFKQGWEQIGPVNPLTDNIFSPLWRLHTGKNWYGGEIETEDDKILIAEGKSNQVWDEDTSQLAIAIGNMSAVKKLGISPKRIDNLLDGYTGMIYDLGISQSSLSAKEYGRYTPIINNFVVDSVVKNQNGSNFYLECDKHYKVLNKYENEHLNLNDKEYKEAKAWVEKYSYESGTLTRGINELQMDESIDPKTKYAMLRELKRAQGKIQKAGLNNEDITIDSIGTVADVLGIDKTFSSESIMHRNKDDNGEWKANTWFDTYAKVKETDAYKKANKQGKAKLQKDYYAVYKASAKVELDAGGSTLYPDYTTTTLAKELTTVNADGKKISKHVKNAFTSYLTKDGEVKWTQERVDEYIKNKGNLKTWTKTYSALHAGKKEANIEYVNDMQRGEKALAISTYAEGSIDREYAVVGVERKVSAARWAKEDDVKLTKLHKFITDNKLDSDSSAEDIEKAIKKAKWIDTDRIAAEVYTLVYGKAYGSKTPFGNLPSFAIDGDMLSNSYGSGKHYRRRRHRHRRRGHSGSGSSGSGSSKGGEGSYAKWLKANGYSTSKSTSGTAFKSNLTEAFRKRQLKNLQNTTSRTKK